MADESYYHCEVEVCPSVAENPRHQVEGEAIFELQFQVAKVRKRTIEYYRNSVPSLICPDECDPTVEKIFRIRKSALLRDNCAYSRADNGVLTDNVSILSIILSSLDVSIYHQHRIIYNIYTMAKSMVQNPSYASQTVLAMKVKLSKVTYTREIIGITVPRTEDVDLMPFDDVDTGVARDIMNQSFEDQPIDNFCHANVSAIEALERMIVEGVEDLESIGDCVICMDKFSIGMEARKMPCLHVFHGSCIEKWLERSRLCPLCRFAVPLRNFEGK